MSRIVSKPFDLGIAPHPAIVLPPSIQGNRLVVKPAVYEPPKPTGAVSAFPSMISQLPDLIPAVAALSSAPSRNIY